MEYVGVIVVFLATIIGITDSDNFVFSAAWSFSAPATVKNETPSQLLQIKLSSNLE